MFLMESDQFIGKLFKWAFILCEYYFDVVHTRIGMVNWDVDGLS
jgi:hypothetical protein